VFGQLLTVDSRGDLPVAEPLAWPKGLQIVVVWSGQSASTPRLIQAFEHLAGQSRAAPLLRQLELAARRASAAWRDGEPGEILAASQHYAACLQRLDEAGNIGILTAEHRALAGLSDACGAVYKTSGAGGGDLGFALTADPAVAQRLRRDFSVAGFQVLDRQLGVAGLSVSGRP
jgi:mevalonate kinase